MCIESITPMLVAPARQYMHLSRCRYISVDMIKLGKRINR